MTETQQQLAASRMLTARLHLALKTVIEAYDSEPEDMTPKTSQAVKEMRRELEHNEPEVLRLLAAADLDRKVERLVAAAREAASKFSPPGEIEVQAVSDAMDELTAALTAYDGR